MNSEFLSYQVREAGGSYTDKFKQAVCGLAHELKHTTQGNVERLSIRSEAEAYLFEAGVRTELHVPKTRFQEKLLANANIWGTRDNLTHDLCALCRMRSCFMEYFSGDAANWYANEPLDYSSGYFGEPIPVVHQHCQSCSDTSCPYG